jgi:hypothetical protein
MHSLPQDVPPGGVAAMAAELAKRKQKI